MKTIRIVKDVMNFRPGSVLKVGNEVTDTVADFLVSKGFAECADPVGKVREAVSTRGTREAVTSGTK